MAIGAVWGAVITGNVMTARLGDVTKIGAVPFLGGISLESNEKKVRHVVWLSPQTVTRLDAARTFDNCRSRSEFMERAVNFYAGCLSARNQTEFFAAAISQTVSGVMAAAESRLARLQFKEAVELAKLSHMMAAASDIDEETLRRLHARCVEEVKRINGVVRLEDAVQFQRRND